MICPAAEVSTAGGSLLRLDPGVSVERLREVVRWFLDVQTDHSSVAWEGLLVLFPGQLPLPVGSFVPLSGVFPLFAGRESLQLEFDHLEPLGVLAGVEHDLCPASRGGVREGCGIRDDATRPVPTLPVISP